MIPLQAEGLHTFYGKSHILHGVGLFAFCFGVSLTCVKHSLSI